MILKTHTVQHRLACLNNGRKAKMCTVEMDRIIMMEKCARIEK